MGLCLSNESDSVLVMRTVRWSSDYVLVMRTVRWSSDYVLVMRTVRWSWVAFSRLESLQSLQSTSVCRRKFHAWICLSTCIQAWICLSTCVPILCTLTS